MKVFCLQRSWHTALPKLNTSNKPPFTQLPLAHDSSGLFFEQGGISKGGVWEG